MPSLPKVSLLALAAALAALSLHPAANAADHEATVARAQRHLADFPGRTLHGSGHGYQSTDAIIDADGAEHVRFERLYKGLRVIGGDLVVHSDRSGRFQHASQTLKRLIDMPVQPGISSASATRAALDAHPGQTRGLPPTLVVHARGELPALAWDVRVYGEQADGTPIEKHVIVDAHNARVLDAWDDIHTGAVTETSNGNSFFDGTVGLTTNRLSATKFELRDPSRGGQYTTDMNNSQGGNGTLFIDADNVWGNGMLSSRQTVGVDAQYGTAVTWDYFKNMHGRTGIANNGKGAYNRVHYGSRYNNAFWSDGCFCMTYGDGDGSTFNPFTSLDVAGHEMSHGVTSRTAGLIYSGESGGLNESTSDIFGTLVEFYANNGNDTPDYYIGEKLFKSGTSAIRSMIRPSADGRSADCWYSGVGSLDVHYSSGVGNHFFYLLAEGSGAGTTPGTAQGSPTCQPGDTRVASGSASLSGIGRDAAAKIWYRALTAYMTSSTNYAAARTATLNAAADLFGAGSTEQIAVDAAWAAVRVTGN
ncbi:MAG: hypothetical protein RJA36_3814 [Pseudomonadota bacterium]